MDQSTNMTFSRQPEQVFRRSANAIHSAINDITVFMNLDDGQFHELNKVGTAIWSYIKEPKNKDSICSFLVEKYEIDTATCEREVTQFLVRMLDLKLVEMVSERD